MVQKMKSNLKQRAGLSQLFFFLGMAFTTFVFYIKFLDIIDLKIDFHQDQAPVDRFYLYF